MSLSIKDAGAWKESKGLSVKDAGTWKEVDTCWVKKDGIWQKAYESGISPVFLHPNIVLEYTMEHVDGQNILNSAQHGDPAHTSTLLGNLVVGPSDKFPFAIIGTNDHPNNDVQVNGFTAQMNSFSVSFWFKMNEQVDDENVNFFRAGGNEFYIMYDGDPANDNVYAKFNAAAGWSIFLTSFTKTAVGQWYMVTVAVDEYNSDIYINNSLEASSYETTAVENLDSFLYFMTLNGEMSRVRAFNAYITQADVTALWNNGNGV